MLLGISTSPDRKDASLYGIGCLPDSGELIMTVGLCLRRQDKCFVRKRSIIGVYPTTL